MITLITGAPGSGKSAALVDLLSQLGKDRVIYASGIPDLQIPHEELADPLQWPALVPDGSVIVIDEVQRVWRPRGPGSKVPDSIQALETHRHRGLDFYVVTQSPRLIDANVRGLVGRHVHLRDIGILGRFWYEWPETCDACSAAWKNAPIKKRYRLPKSAFGLYKSASVHIKPVRSFPMMLVVMLGALLLVGGLSWKAYGMISSKIKPPVPVSTAKPAGSLDSILSRPAAVPAAASLPVGYDTTQFIPRVSNVPESAPAFDHLRVINAMPQIVGGACMGSKCRCYTIQGTDSGLSVNECRAWLSNPPFNPYAVASSGGPSAGTERPANPSPVPHSTVGNSAAALPASVSDVAGAALLAL